MDLFSYLLGKKKGGGSSDLDWSTIGYNNAPQSVINNYNYAKIIYDNWENVDNLSSKFNGDKNLVYMPLVDTSNATSMRRMFYNCSHLEDVPLLNTSNVTDMYQMFYNCSSLKTVPLFDTSKVSNTGNMFYGSILENVPQFDTSSITNFSDMFRSCPNLTDESLDNILKMAININPNYTGTKTLRYWGIYDTTYFPTSRIEALPHYQNFINAGWTIGY